MWLDKGAGALVLTAACHRVPQDLGSRSLHPIPKTKQQQNASPHHSEEAEPHLPGPDAVAARAEAVDDDLQRQGRVEVGVLDSRQVVVRQDLADLAVILDTIKSLGAN